MQVIPVVDVRGGVAVAASRGDRASYGRLQSPLAATADPVEVALGLRTLFPFPVLYVADLDGIEGRGPDRAMQQRLAAAWPGTELWIDDGTAGAESLSAVVPPAQAAIASNIIGSESVPSLQDYRRARERAGPAAPLSLDFRGDVFVGARELLENAALWPDRVIVMTLARVGSGEGPDLMRLASVIARAGDRTVYAAGGVRHRDDLRALRDIGAAGALVATALHGGHLSAADLAEIAGT